MTSINIFSVLILVLVILQVIWAAPVDVKPKAKGTEEVIMYGNHQNAPRVKKSDISIPIISNQTEDSSHENQEQGSHDSESTESNSADATAENASEAENSREHVNENTSKDNKESNENHREQFDDKSVPYTDPEESYFPYFSPYRRRREAKALTAEDMSTNDVTRRKRNTQLLTAEDMVMNSPLINRARRDANQALTAEDMTSVTSEKKLQRAKRNIYDDIDESNEYKTEDQDELDAYDKPRDSDIYDDLNEDDKLLLLRYLEKNPQILDLLSMYGNDERTNKEQWERAREEEEEREEIKEALRYLDQLETDRSKNDQEDEDDPVIEYETIVYHGEPGIFIPIPEDTEEVNKRNGYSDNEDAYTRWQEVAEEQAENEREEGEYREAYGKLLELAQALKQRDNDK